MVVHKFKAGKHQKLYTIFALLIFALITIPLVLDYLYQPPEFNCNEKDLLPSDPKTYKVHPIKLVVKPWHGQHHVYAIFMLPNEYKPGRLALLDIDGVTSYPKQIFSRGRWTDGIQAKPEHYLVRVNIKTRIALIWIAKGSFEKLRQPCNWTLTYTK